MKRSRFRPAARRDLKRLVDFFSNAPPEIAEAMTQALEARAEQLRSFPFIGRPVSNTHLRETIVPYGKSRYLIRYEVSDDAIVIVRIWHGRENR